MKISDLHAIFFDFDGVILDSTRIKTETFKSMFEGYGEEIVEKIVTHHLQHGGISRVEKLKHYHESILNHSISETQLEELAEKFSNMVKDRVVNAEWILGAEDFLKEFHQQVNLYIISGTPQNELLDIVARRDMSRYFQEILGSPIKKPVHVRRILEQQSINRENCIFVGDALTDRNTALETGTHFIGIQGEVTFPKGTIVLPDCTSLASEIENL